MIHGINHVAISTGDIERSVAFYRDLLGLEEVFRLNWEVGEKPFDAITGLEDSSARIVMLKAGNCCVELFEYRSPPPKPAEARRPVCDHGITHLCLQVTSINDEYERLKAAGMTFHCPPQQVGSDIQATYGRDPDGNVVELLEVPADSALSVVAA
jgi:catechol 2,3-dioxygenase-like lactoylglutathione lyase family enzyme